MKETNKKSTKKTNNTKKNNTKKVTSTKSNIVKKTNTKTTNKKQTINNKITNKKEEIIVKVEKAKKYLNRNVIFNTIFNFIMLFLVEVIFKLVNNFNIIDWSTLRILISTFIISVIVSGILYFIPKRAHKYVNIILVLVASIYACAQTGFNNYIGVYMSLGTSSQLGAVVDYIRDFIMSFKWTYFLTLIPFVISLVYYIFFNKKITKRFNLNYYTKIKNINSGIFFKKLSIALLLIVMLSGVYFSTLVVPFMQNKLQTVSNRKLFKNPSVPSVAIKQFGVTEFGILDVKNYFIPVEEENEFEIIEKVEEEDNTRKFDDTKWNELIENESDETLNTLNKYFINNNITDVNEYTGMFEGKNLIVIMLESVNDIFINPEDYPNFYKMYSEGWHWENNYSPRNSCATGNNEMSGMIGLYSIYNTCTANNYKDNEYFESIFGVFNQKPNYYTFSAHNYSAHYYDRDTIHTNMGSKKYYSVEDLGISWSSLYKNWSSDEDFMTEVLNILDTVETENFMTWLTTVSSHQPYGISSNEGDKYLDLYKDRDIHMLLKRYKSKLKVLDEGLGILLNGLEERGILDDTVIVMFGDHYPYGIPTKTINTILDYDTSVDYESERVPFVIYNSEIESKTFSEYTAGLLHIVPTVANLFGLEHDPRLYVGTDLLSEEYESLVVFADGSWKNEKAYYNASKGDVKYYGEEEYSIEELQAINKTIEMKMNMSSLAIKNNYFNYLNKSLNDIKVEETTEVVETNEDAS